MGEVGIRRDFGQMPDGSKIEAVKISAGRLSADILSFGAVVRDLRLQDVDHPLVLGFETLDDYLKHSRFCGATAGRYANRIAGGRFRLDGQDYQLERNFLGRHHLHGGSDSFGTRPWAFDTVGDASVVLALASPDGEGGYPGAVDVSCTIEILPPSTMRITYEAQTTAPTILNLAHHSYFNLDGSADILGHSLQIPADSYLPVDDTLIPTGEIASVSGTPFDFRKGRRIRASGIEPTLYDHNYCLAREPFGEPAFHAALRGESGIGMTLLSTEPGLQFYDGASLDVPVPGLDGRTYGPHAGLCLEPQRWPDSPNRPEFTDATLRPGETYRQVSQFEFSG
jgi:aldose 1-epimerase